MAPDELREVALKSLPRPSRLAAPVTALKGAGPRLAAAASELGIETLGDLVLHMPHRYAIAARSGAWPSCGPARTPPWRSR